MGFGKMGFSFFIAFLWVSTGFAENEGFGRFVGTFKNEKTQQEQLAKIDFIVSKTEANDTQLAAVLTLHFGGFESSEYVSFHFPSVRYVFPSFTLIFNTNEGPLTFISNRFDLQSGEFSARVKTKWTGGEIGTLSLKRDGTASPSLPLLSGLGGEYEGSCDGTKTLLQLYPFRNRQGASSVGNPFSQYEIRGQLSQRSATDPEWAVHRIISDGSYDFFKGRMKLISPREVFDCKVTPEKIDCGQCHFASVVSAENPVLKPIQSGEAFPLTHRDRLEVRQIESGFYKGYIHHEFLNQFQPAELDLTIFPDGEETWVAASGRMLFGEDSHEEIPLKFEEQLFPNPIGPQRVVLQNSQDEVDPIIQLIPTGKGVLRGVWYSHLFGRVGTFELRKEGTPELPSTAQMIEQVSGQYRSDQWLVQIDTREDLTPLNTTNPFAPNAFHGFFKIPQVSARLSITGGSYDFYTGLLALEMLRGDGSSRMWIGKRRSRQMIEFDSALAVFGAYAPRKSEKFFLWSAR